MRPPMAKSPASDTRRRFMRFNPSESNSTSESIELCIQRDPSPLGRLGPGGSPPDQVSRQISESARQPSDRPPSPPHRRPRTPVSLSLSLDSFARRHRSARRVIAQPDSASFVSSRSVHGRPARRGGGTIRAVGGARRTHQSRRWHAATHRRA
eukprot:484774-Prorocentrum_minimum.AAC.1